MIEKLLVFYCLASIICNPGQGYFNILDKSTVEEGEMFTMTCDYLRFDYTNEMIDTIHALFLHRTVVNGPHENTLFILQPTLPWHFFQRIPANRKWDFWIDYGKAGYEGQKEKINLTIAVLDTTMADSGSYICEMQYMSDKGLIMKRAEHLTVTKSTYPKPTYSRRTTRITTAAPPQTTNSPVTKAVGHQPILDKSTVKEGERFKMTCDYKRFEIVNSGIYIDDYINHVQLSRRSDGSLKYSLIYRYCPRLAINNHLTGIPPGRTWDVNIVHGEHQATQEFISMTVTVNDTIYSDSGSYECSVLFATKRESKRNETLTVIKTKTDQTTTTGKRSQTTTAVINGKTTRTTTAVSTVIKGKTTRTTTAAIKDKATQTTTAAINGQMTRAMTEVINGNTEPITTAEVVKGKTEQITTEEEVKGKTEQIITEGYTTKNKRNSVDKKDYPPSVLLLLVFILVMALLL